MNSGKKKTIATILVASAFAMPIVSSAIEDNISNSINFGATKPANPSGFSYCFGGEGIATMTYFRDNGTFGAVGHELDDAFDVDGTPFVFGSPLPNRKFDEHNPDDSPRADILANTQVGVVGSGFSPEKQELDFVANNLQNLHFGNPSIGEAWLLTSDAQCETTPEFIKIQIDKKKYFADFVNRFTKHRPRDFTLHICDTVPNRSLSTGESGSTIIQYNQEESRYEIVGSLRSRISDGDHRAGFGTFAEDIIKAELQTHETVNNVIDTDKNQEIVDKKLDAFNNVKKIAQPIGMFLLGLGGLGLFKSAKKEDTELL